MTGVLPARSKQIIRAIVRPQRRLYYQFTVSYTLITPEGKVHLAREKFLVYPRFMMSLRWINSVWHNDAMCRHRSGSTLVQVMAWCLTAPSHYLSQCWLIISEVQWQSPVGDFTRDTSAINHKNYLEDYLSKISFKSARDQWVNTMYFEMLYDRQITKQVDGLVQERCNSIANALELHRSCTDHRSVTYSVSCMSILDKKNDSCKEVSL